MASILCYEYYLPTECSVNINPDGSCKEGALPEDCCKCREGFQPDENGECSKFFFFLLAILVDVHKHGTSYSEWICENVIVPPHLFLL